MSDEKKKENTSKSDAQGQAKGEKSSKQPKGDKSAKGGKPGAEAPAAPKGPSIPAPPPRLRERFKAEICPRVKEQFKVTNPMALPRLEKVMITAGIGKQLEGSKLNPKAKEAVLKDLAAITGQKPIMCKAKKSIANFKLRAGYEVGAMVTLRGARMWEFVDRLITTAIPRIKDFRGLRPTSFDGRGNYSFGVTEQGIFPEINMAEAEFTHGLNVAFIFRNSTNEKSLFVLKELGVPFVRPEDDKAPKRH